MQLRGKKILLGVSGSIAAYKIATLIRLLVKDGAEVKVIMSEAATSFITPLTLSTLSKNPVYHDVHDSEQWNNHVELGLWADLYIIAPVTANTLSAMSHGSCTNMLMAVYLSARCPVWVAPAMDIDMWKHPSTQRNMATLRADGVRDLGVGTGELASGLVGPGRMAEPEQIFTATCVFFSSVQKPFKALVTAGPTYEDIDPVRYIGNRSTGKMGMAIAQAFADQGIHTHLVLGPTTQSISAHALIEVHRVRSASEMAEESIHLFPSINFAVMAAAVADYTPSNVSETKIKKKDGDLSIALKRTVDIAATLGSQKSDNQITVGFALETNEEQRNATRKLEKKNFDFIALNSLNDKGAGFGFDTNKITLISSDGIDELGLASKKEHARRIVSEILALNEKKNR